MSDINTWSELAANNNATPPAGFPEGMSPASVNDAAREVMAAVKRSWDRSNPSLTSTGSGNAYALTYEVGPAAYTDGEIFHFIPNFTNTDVATLNINDLGAVSIKASDGATSLTAGMITTGYPVAVAYNGVGFQLLNGFNVTGDVTGIGAGALDLTLAPSGVTAGTYANLSIDAKGRVTAARNLTTIDLAGVLGTASVFNVGGSGAVIPLLSGVNTWSAVQTFSAEVDLTVPTGSVLALASNAGTVRIIYFSTLVAGVPTLRWSVDANSAAETGSNVGSDFNIFRYNDAGTPVDAPLTITRSTGVVQLNTLNVTTTVSAAGNITTGGTFGSPAGIVGSNGTGNKTVAPTSAGVPTIGAGTPGAVGDTWYEF